MYHIKNSISRIYDDLTELDLELNELDENQKEISQSIEFKELLNILDNFVNNYK